MSIFFSATDAESSSSWFIVFSVLALKLTRLSLFSPQNKFGLGSLTDFSSTRARELRLQQKVALAGLSEGRCGLDISFFI